jgi:hypothetical protein
MARIRRSKTNNTFFMDIPRYGETGRKWKKIECDDLEVFD